MRLHAPAFTRATSLAMNRPAQRASFDAASRGACVRDVRERVVQTLSCEASGLLLIASWLAWSSA